jgi:hypothetical protein
MTYGLIVQNANLKTQIDSTYEMFGMAVKSLGVASEITGVNYDQDIIAIRRQNLSSGRNEFIAPSWNSSRTAVTFHNGDFRTTGQPMPRMNVSYFHLTQANNTGFTYPDTYGLQVKTPAGQLAFDSRAIVSNIRPVFLNFYPPLYFQPYSNGLPDNPSPDQVSDDLKDYISIMGAYIGPPGTIPAYPQFATGIRFLNNVFDDDKNKFRTGAFYDSTASLGPQPNMPNLYSIHRIRDSYND